MKTTKRSKENNETVKKSKGRAPKKEKKIVNKFITGNYSLKLDEKTGQVRIMADHPCRCPLCNEDDDNSKKMRFHMPRIRKGEMGVDVYYCKVHKHHFTVYPLGYVPYSKIPIVKISNIKHTTFNDILEKETIDDLKKAA